MQCSTQKKMKMVSYGLYGQLAQAQKVRRARGRF